MANYLITGGAGFIGSNIVDFLVEQGESVRVLDDFSTGHRANLARSLGRIELIEGDLRDAEVCARAAEDMDFVLHEAAIPSVPRSVAEPVETSSVNVLGTIQLLDACVRAKVRRFVFAASSSAYGDRPEPVKGVELLPEPRSPYAAAKLAGEAFCQAFWHSYGLETICLRYFNIFGPRQDPDSPYSAVIPKFVAAMREGRRPVVNGDGLQSRDFTYVENAVRANILATRAGGEAVGRVFNIACGESFTLLELIAAINARLGTKIEAEFGPPQPGDVRHSKADIAPAREVLGYEVAVGFEEGLRRTIESGAGA